VRVPVTNRAWLRVRGEQVVPVPPLAVSAETVTPTLAELGQVPVVALFVARAPEVQPGLALPTPPGGTLAALWRRLDGLPLARELAAGGRLS
jgi:predicted ATPase